MIPSLLDELKEGRFKLINHTPFPIKSSLYHTESGWKVLIEKRVTISGQRVGCIFGWRIKKAIKEYERLITAPQPAQENE